MLFSELNLVTIFLIVILFISLLICFLTDSSNSFNLKGYLTIIKSVIASNEKRKFAFKNL